MLGTILRSCHFLRPDRWLVRAAKIVSRREHAAAQQLFAAAAADLFRPGHPAVLAQAEKMTGVLVRSESEVVDPEHHHTRGPIRSVERGLPCERKIRHP